MIIDSLNRANPATLADHFRTIKLGQTLSQDVKQTLRVDADAGGNQAEDLVTLDSIVPPSPATVVLRAFARVGGVTGELAVVGRHTTPASGQIAVAPSGNVVVLAADAITSLVVEYISERGDVVTTADLPVVADVLTLPAAITGHGLTLMSAVALTATATGRKVSLTPGGAPAAGQAAMDVAGATVTFAAADVVTLARCVLLVDPAANLTTLLNSDSPAFI
jgi:hypothetical protein